MVSFLAPHIIIICFVSLCIDSRTKINGLWSDDFSFDINQVNGWHIYNEKTGDLLENPTISANHKYHGKFSKILDGKSESNFLQREFECLQDSKVSISYKFAFCATESSDRTQMIWSSVLTNTKEDGMDYSSPNSIKLSTIEDIDLFANGIQLNGVSEWCNELQEWSYQSVSNLQVGYVNAYVSWELIFSQKFSGSNEYGLLFDISINCASIISNSLVTQIDGNWFDDFIFNTDINQVNGWNIYNDISGILLDNIIVTTNRKYHGKFTRIGNGKLNFMSRKFECLKDSKVYISYKFGYCKTESTDITKMVWISDITNSKQMGMGHKSAIDMVNIEGNVNGFETNIKPVNNGTDCDEINEWYYQNVTNLYVGYADAGFEWELSFSQKFSSPNEYGLLFDISINCQAIGGTDSGTNELNGNGKNDLETKNPNNNNNKENIQTNEGSVKNDTKHTNTVLIIIAVVILVLGLFSVYWFYFRHQTGLKEKLLFMHNKDKHANINLV